MIKKKKNISGNDRQHLYSRTRCNNNKYLSFQMFCFRIAIPANLKISASIPIHNHLTSDFTLHLHVHPSLVLDNFLASYLILLIYDNIWLHSRKLHVTHMTASLRHSRVKPKNVTLIKITLTLTLLKPSTTRDFA